MKNRQEILEKIIEDSFYIVINLGDTFYYACADSEKIEGEDYIELIPLIEKYGYYAEVAYCAIKRGHDPQVKQVLTNDYYLAKEEIFNMIKKGNRYTPFYGLTSSIDIKVLENKSWIDVISNFFKVEKKIKYNNIPDLLKSINCTTNSVIGNDDFGHHIKINSFSKTLAIVENIKYKGETKSSWEYVIEFYELIKLIEDCKYVKIENEEEKIKSSPLSIKERELFEKLAKEEED